MLKKFLSLMLLILPALVLISCAGSNSLYNQGKDAFNNEEYSKAIELYKQETAANPGNHLAWREMGIAYYKNKNIPDAISSLSKALEIKNDDGESIFYLGLIAESMEEYDKAISFYQDYLKISDPDSDIEESIDGRIKLISRKKIEKEIKLAVQNEAALSNEIIPENTLAVLYFENLGTNKELDPLQKGLAEMLITDLSQVKGLRVVERIKLQKLLDEIGLKEKGIVRGETAPRVGRLIKASRLVKGTFLNNEDELRVDAGYIQTKSGEYESVKNVNGNLEEYFKLQKELTFNIIDEMGIQITDEEREAIQVIPTESYLAFVAYSKGLDLEDRGMYQEAADQFNSALNLDPGFVNAEVKMNEAEVLNKAENEFSQLETQVTQGDLMNTSDVMDRLIDSNANLTGEVVTGRDDRNPNNNAGFGRAVPVQIEIIIPTR